MGADLYSAGLLVQHGISGSVAVPHREDKVKVSRIYQKKVGNTEAVVQPEPEEKKSQEPHKHDHHHSEFSIKMAKEIGTDYNFKREIVWFNAIGFLVLHCCGVYGVFLMFGGYAKIWTTIYCKMKEFLN